MSLGKHDVRNLIDIYLRAWTTQDPDLILTVFTPTATYHERALGEPICDHAGIREYWQSKVVEAQANIQTELLNLYLDGTTAIAEWEARFDDVVQGTAKGCAKSPFSSWTATGWPACGSTGPPSVSP